MSYWACNGFHCFQGFTGNPSSVRKLRLEKQRPSEQVWGKVEKEVVQRPSSGQAQAPGPSFQDHA